MRIDEWVLKPDRVNFILKLRLGKGSLCVLVDIRITKTENVGVRFRHDSAGVGKPRTDHAAKVLDQGNCIAFETRTADQTRIGEST
jgi:hypothetical protein